VTDDSFVLFAVASSEMRLRAQLNVLDIHSASEKVSA
jgi:hypothetical protein